MNQVPQNFEYEVLPEDYAQYDLSFKLIVIGDSGKNILAKIPGVGKSCLTAKATKNTFETEYSATVGFEFFTSNIKLDDKVIKLQIWDTCGQENYRSLINNFYRSSALAIIVYSIDNMDSFENIEGWLREIKTHSNPDVKFFLIGNKCDLEEKRKVNKDMALKFKEDNNLDYFSESSAKTGFNAQSVFVDAAKIIYADYLKYKDRQDKSRSSSNASSRFNTRLVNPNKQKEKTGEITPKKSCC